MSRQIRAQTRPGDTKAIAAELAQLGQRGQDISDSEIDLVISAFPMFFRALMDGAGKNPRTSRALATKFRDAGRRSAPWKPVSSRVAGRPQDGADGNRINRWLLPDDHKQYASQRDATLVEIRYYLQALSFTNSPAIPIDEFEESWGWLVDHPVKPGAYLEPLQLLPIDMDAVLSDPRSITSGHITPLDRGGRHIPSNAFLILSRSNQMQGNMTIPEFLKLADDIVRRHKENGTFPVD